MNNHYDSTSTLDIVLVEVLLKGENVVIPGLGYLELKTVADRRTVLFKALKPDDPIMQPFSGKEKEDSSVLYNTISAPLLKGKVVNLPTLGIFHPLKKEDGSLRVSFTPAASLRKQLNGEPEMLAAPVFLPVIQAETPEPEKEIEAPEKEEEKNILIIPEIRVEKKPVAERIPETKVIPYKEKEIKTAPKKINTAQKGDIIIPEDRTDPKQKKKNNLFTWASIVALVIIIGIVSIISQNKKEEPPVVEESDSVTSVNLPYLANKNYGNPIFWVYIYEANRDKLTSPVNIPADMQLVIPDLSQYNVDVTDSVEINKARVLSDKILKH
ncbi:hypothetical protein FACS189474_3920 [Bacteroidia bacterium]|nr:hypothetical protein FACS189474_3920 [Bacteroidia bacterium]